MFTTFANACPAADGEPVKPPGVSPALLDKDGLRLLGLSRVPRCAACARLAAMLAAHRGGNRLPVPWPVAPPGCREQICAPLVKRMAAGAATRRELLSLQD